MAEITPSAVAAARGEFLALVRNWSAALDDTTESADAINACVDALWEWVDRLDETTPGLAQQVLPGFMADDDPATRYLAAALMASHGAEEQALAVAQELAENDNYGAVSSKARTSLRAWRRKKAKERSR